MSNLKPVADTAPIRSEEAFDEARVATVLRRALPELIGDTTISFDQFPGGAANLTYRVVAGQTELVLRRAPLGEVAKGGHDMAREYRVLSRLWRSFPKAPRAYYFCEDPAVMGKEFFVMERRRGHVVRDSWPQPFGDDIAKRRRTCEQLVDTLAELHRVNPASVDLDNLGRPDGFVNRQVAGWARRWQAVRTRDVSDMDTLIAELAEKSPDPERATILHNDFKLDNTMVSDDGEVVAVFDWDMATRGDPLVDLGTFVAHWVDDSGPMKPVFGNRVRALTPYMSKAEVVERYAARTGFDVSAVSYHVAFAFYRLAIIMEQIYARYRLGQTTDQRFASFEPAAPLLVSAARATLADDFDDLV